MTRIKTLTASKIFYHVYCRGNNKNPIFFVEEDYSRLLATILLFQSTTTPQNFSRLSTKFRNRGLSIIDRSIVDQVRDQRIVELIAFVFMPNHFHLLLGEIEDGGISNYMKRVLNSYTKYLNIRHERSGHIFQGRFGRVPIIDNNQLLYLSTYLHRNPRELPGWQNKEDAYPWSSYQDYIKENRWGMLLAPDIILSQFSSKTEYVSFTKISIAKTKKALDLDLLYPSFPH